MQTLNDYFDAVRDAAKLRGWELTHVHRDGEPGVTHFILSTERDGHVIRIESHIHDDAFQRETQTYNAVMGNLRVAQYELIQLMRAAKLGG